MSEKIAIPELKVFAAPGQGEGIAEFPGVSIQEVSDPLEIKTNGSPAALLLSGGDEWSEAQLKDLPSEVVILASQPKGRETSAKADRVFLPFDEGGDRGSLAALLKSTAQQSAALLAATRAQAEMKEVNKIGMALMSERDPDALLGLILTQARHLTTSDAGSLYLVEEGEEGVAYLHFLLAQNDTLPDLPNPDFILPLDTTSVAGYVGSTGDTLVIDDAYEIPDHRPYTFNRGFDEAQGYRGKSMLVVPMVDHRDKVVGVLQLINRKRAPSGEIRDDASANALVIPYSQRDVEIVQGLAGQAAVSIENGKLYQDIENLFEGFIKAAVTAIDQRDPTTSGHSVRVTALTCDLAQAAHDATEGPYKDVFFSRDEMKQLRYAGLLHDFGKVGVREEVLVKMNKLSPVLEATVLARFDYIEKWLEAENERKKAAYLLEAGTEGFMVQRQVFDRELAEALTRMEAYRKAVKDANTPRVLEEDAAGILDEIAASTYSASDGTERPYLTEEELHFLKIPRGSLDPAERLQIESHVVHSYNYLLEIPWTDELTRIAEIVQGHHEKLNGKGYPNGIAGDEISLETRFMTVCDIFDALTASDRPYKKAMPVDRALSILRMEADEGALDQDAVDLFVGSKVYEKVLNSDWRDL
jgi:HD-GYP domain-containing protein (c-di-GMP phosphodiesterase class II)